MFSLEANNLLDEDGNSKQTQILYFENNWVKEEDAALLSKPGRGRGVKVPPAEVQDWPVTRPRGARGGGGGE